MNYVELAIPVFLLAIAVEYLYGLLRGRQTYRLNDTVNSLSLGLLSRLVGVLKLGFSAAVFGWIAARLEAPRWPMDAAWQWALAFVAYDFCYYWKHRCGHECRLFWASHVAHHQSEEFNLSTALRQSGTDFLGFAFYVPLYLAGVPPLAVVTVGSLNLVYQFWVHTEHVRRLGPLEWILVTPSNHRVHHARNARYVDRNYGGVFIVWDRLFGTFQDELPSEPCVYGIVKPLRSWNPLWANLHVWAEMLRLTLRARSWGEAWRAWLKPPGWQPRGAAAPAVDLSQPKYDPPAPAATRVYAFVHFWLTLAASLVLLLMHKTMVGALVWLLFAWTAGALYVLGAALEDRPGWPALEWARIAAAGLAGAAVFLLWPQYARGWGAGLSAYALLSAAAFLALRLSGGLTRTGDRVPAA